MPDTRWNELGVFLINYSLKVQPSERLVIVAHKLKNF